ncbi:M14 family metallopeptidase [Alteromonas mediterranea]|uniref:M14 family metallopeptidase n=1 Tax=Alteromonas mediterranea TaxID=314275 RepID=UPI00241CDE2A|nr:M14-type cytosolic carboxypeptidase [Alteromonas mediterranea]
MHISSQFDSGNIHVVRATSPEDILLTIPKDNQSDFAQWFHFRLVGEAFVTHTMTIAELATSAYPEGWKDYNVLASYDRQNWFRVPSDFDGRDMSMLVIGEETPEKKKVWITARQHPGETMAQWCAQGIIYRLLDEQDGLARQLLDKAVFYIVPNMNPDGSARGHLRTNAVGTNLNREWAEPTKEKSPEVLYVFNAMSQIGVDMYLDLHGDEALPYNFVAGTEGNPSYNSEIEALENTFKQALLNATPEFQDEFGYDKDAPGEANLAVASNAVGEKFNCMAYTVEMPFKDNADLPDKLYGWSVQRSEQLGEDLLIAVNAVVNALK